MKGKKQITAIVLCFVLVTANALCGAGCKKKEEQQYDGYLWITMYEICKDDPLYHKHVHSWEIPEGTTEFEDYYIIFCYTGAVYSFKVLPVLEVSKGVTNTYQVKKNSESCVFYEILTDKEGNLIFKETKTIEGPGDYSLLFVSKDGDSLFQYKFRLYLRLFIG